MIPTPHRKQALHHKVKRAFSLLEAMIAIVLFMIVSASIFGLYRHGLRSQEKLSSLKNDSEITMRAHSRLLSLFSSLIKKSAKHHHFFTPEKCAPFQKGGTQSLIFTFDNGIDKEVGFSYDVLSRLCLTKNSELALYMWPNTRLAVSKPTKVRKEVLFENVEDLLIEFWQTKQDNNASPENGPRWTKMWPKEKKELPLLVKITLYMKSTHSQEPKKKTFVFIANTTAITPFQIGGL